MLFRVVLNFDGNKWLFIRRRVQCWDVVDWVCGNPFQHKVSLNGNYCCTGLDISGPFGELELQTFQRACATAKVKTGNSPVVAWIETTTFVVTSR